MDCGDNVTTTSSTGNHEETKKKNKKDDDHHHYKGANREAEKNKTENSTAATIAKNSDDDIPELLLEEFFEDIEKLTIHSDGDDDSEKKKTTKNAESMSMMNKNRTSTSHKDNSNSCHGAKVSDDSYDLPPNRQQQQQETNNLLLNRVEKNKQSWQEFKIDTTSTVTSQASTISSTATAKISFSLATNKKKKTKKSKKQTNKKSSSTDASASTTTTDFEESSPASTEQAKTNNTIVSPPTKLTGFQQPQLEPPRWIVVLDTCAVIESFDATCDIIDTATRTTSRKEMPMLSSRVPTSSHDSSWVEPITVVVPYKLWTELDYRTKETSIEKNQQYKTRRALRMLNRELENAAAATAASEQQQPQHHQQYSAPSNMKQQALADAVIRSQSRVDMNRAARDFLGRSSNSNDSNGSGDISINNDDHILSCALAEQRRFLYMTTLDETCSMRGTQSSALPPNCATNTTTVVGGVVLLTLDKVLSGKARADGIKVYTPEAFIKYYRKRSASLQQRAIRTMGK